MASSSSGPHSNGMCGGDNDHWELPTVSIIPEGGDKSGIVWPASTSEEGPSSSKALYDLSAVDFSVKLPKAECSTDMHDDREPSSRAERTAGPTLFDFNRNHEEKV